jgi:hypothetical protein
MRKPKLSFKGEVQVYSDSKWYDNALRFETHKEAEDYVIDLGWRWTSVRNTRVVESDDPVNYRMVEGGAERIK